MTELALSFTEQLAPADLGCAHFFVTAFYQLSGQVRESQEYAQSAILLANEFGAGQWAAKAGIIRGWALASQGHMAEGIEQIKQNLSTLSQTGPHLARPYYLSLLAQAYRYGGQAEKGLSIMNEALAIMEKVGEYLWEADLVRCLGDLHQHSSGGNKVEEHYLKAREIARHRGLRLPELRAAKSLVRLWQAQDRSKEMEARRILQSIYSCFEEGFDAPDLKEARELLGVPS
jgi:predicted ATPase